MFIPSSIYGPLVFDNVGANIFSKEFITLQIFPIEQVHKKRQASSTLVLEIVTPLSTAEIDAVYPIPAYEERVFDVWEEQEGKKNGKRKIKKRRKKESRKKEKKNEKVRESDLHCLLLKLMLFILSLLTMKESRWWEKKNKQNFQKKKEETKKKKEKKKRKEEIEKKEESEKEERRRGKEPKS